MNLFKTVIFMVNICLLLLISMPVLAKDLKIITPYWGTEENTYINESYGLKLNDSQTTKGLYIQSINPEKYQWNLFFYQTEDINYSDLSGINFIYDYYFGVDRNVKNVAGIGANFIQMDFDGENVQTANGILNAFELEQEIFSFYIRIGRHHNYEYDQSRLTFMPWIGGQLDQCRGSGLVELPGPGTVSFKIDEDQYSWIAGINFKIDFHHFLQLEVKPSLIYQNGEYLKKRSAMVNLFLTRNWGLSYRYNYHETNTGEDSYNIFGVAVTF